MAIEERLRSLAQTNSNYSLLLAQWEFDKKLLQRALNAVSTTFPHYSLHDSSHSSTIITQIEKIILPDIDKLSATDCWLLLESCYWHDAGMIITKQQKKDLVNDKEFQIFLDEHIEFQSDLSIHAKKIKNKTNIESFDDILQFSDSMMFLIADYFRRKHPKVSGEYVYNPELIEVKSPRNYLIPSRLFGIMSEIVECHGKDRCEILRLPHTNDGMDANDYAHPRYVAALLRLGDLLDIDDGRFCETLMASIGDVPKTSIDHKGKHDSVTSLYINCDLIEIVSICKEYGSYNAQRGWFDYIADEFHFQKNNWNNISPNNKYKTLPVISKLECKLIDHIGIDNAPPKIKLDIKRVYDYITNTSIYNEKYPYIREIIQNAIDATIYKVWSDIDYKFQGRIEEYCDIELREQFINLLNKEKIDILLHPLTSFDDKLKYRLSVRDYATGMSLEDVKKVLNVGSPSSSKRKRFLNSMPNWAKPNGFFGIGLQSVFTMSDDVVIKTRCPYGSGYIIEVIKTGSNPDFKIREFKDDYFHGTEVALSISENKIPTSVPSSASNVVRSFDPFCHDKLEIIPSIIADLIGQTFRSSPIELLLNGDNFLNQNTNDEEEVFHTDFTNGMDFALRVDLESKYTSSVYYKRSKIEAKFLTSGLSGVSGVVDLFCDNAGDWVTINRAELKREKLGDLLDLINLVVKENRVHITNNTDDKSEAAFFYYSRFDIKNDNLWQDYVINGIPVKDYFFSEKPIGFHVGGLRNKNLIDFNSYLTVCLAELCVRLKYSVRFIFTGEHEEDVRYGGKYHTFNVILNDDGKENISVDKALIKKGLNSKSRQLRYVIPCYHEDYLDISLPVDKVPLWAFNMLHPWAFNKFLVAPRDDVFGSRLEDARGVYKYYKDHDVTVLDVDVFVRKYMDMWEDMYS
ncbi:hypothetical protein [Kosakonia sp.]|uniref:HD domain-containing protein n=1 Tax=Kosakonia sp. TaxID=1916651 RepID=UPI0028B20889|nr:hypothetical protein [Kosakonia sp.]